MVACCGGMVVGSLSGVFVVGVGFFRLYCLIFSLTCLLFIKCGDFKQHFAGSVGSCMSRSDWCSSFCVSPHAEHLVGCHVGEVVGFVEVCADGLAALICGSMMGPSGEL